MYEAAFSCIKKAGVCMNIKEFYDLIGENYNEVLDRLRVESRILKYVLKFPDDKSCETFQSSMKDQKYAEAFRAVHTLKGICLNLGFTKLYSTVSEITEKLRDNEDAVRIESDDEIKELSAKMIDQYKEIISGIDKLK